MEHWWKNFTSTFLLLPIPDSMPFIQLVSGDHCVSKNSWLSFQSSNIYILIMLEPCQAKQWPWAYWGSLTVLGGLMVDCDVLHIALDWFNSWDPPYCLFPHSMPQIVGRIRCDGGRTSVRRSGSVRFFAPKTGNRGPQPVQDQPRYWGNRTEPPRTGLLRSMVPFQTGLNRFFCVKFVVPI